jgi:hypothetical protein
VTCVYGLAAQRLDASAVMINDHTAFRTNWMPFAGRYQSGYGIGGDPDRAIPSLGRDRPSVVRLGMLWCKPRR